MNKRDNLAIPRAYFSVCCAASRAHSALVGTALDTYGDHGAQISGIIRDHFPDSVKDTLRSLCDTMNAASRNAWGSRPPRVRVATMRRLSQSVARVEGCGFYGPQP